jgi:hypothetical protein
VAEKLSKILSIEGWITRPLYLSHTPEDIRVIVANATEPVNLCLLPLGYLGKKY